ncbi:hypothetical protein LCGC14_2513910, partial [marine sediment metagenome]
VYIRLVSLLSSLGVFLAPYVYSNAGAEAAVSDSPRPESAATALDDTPRSPSSDQPNSDQPRLLILEDPLQPLVPSQPRTEAEEDHLESLALFAAAHTHELRQDYAKALRLYQRAFRSDPQSITVARAIIPLAYRLRRHGEAVRYALKAVELENADPLLLRRLGVYLTEEGKWLQAVALYQRALDAAGGEKDSPADIILRMEMGRLYHLIEEYGKAADCFAKLLALEPDSVDAMYNLGNAKLLLGNAQIRLELRDFLLKFGVFLL